MKGILNGVIIGDSQPVGRDEKAAGGGGGLSIVHLLLFFIKAHAEHGGGQPVRHLAGRQSCLQQAQRIGSRPG